jgi:hypothetical protein
MDARVEPRRLFDRRLYLAAAALFAVIVLVGFGRTYYFSSVFDGPPLPSSLVHVHGALMTTWVALFGTQVWLVSSRRIRLHRRLGYAAIGLAVLMVATGVPVALRAAKYGSATAPPGIAPLAFAIVPLFDLLMFVVFFGGAIYFRRQPMAHKPLMLLTAVNFFPPALARIHIAPLQALGPLWFFGVPTALTVLAVVLDARRYGRVNRVFLAGTLLLVGAFIARLALANTHAWLTVAGWLTSFV